MILWYQGLNTTQVYLGRVAKPASSLQVRKLQYCIDLTLRNLWCLSMFKKLSFEDQIETFPFLFSVGCIGTTWQWLFAEREG
jgi:hypothetical protein